MHLQIKEEFRDLIPPLTKEEFDKLKNSIRWEGCRDPIVTWKGYIIDGHNRYRICEIYNTEFKTIERTDLADEDEVKLWMINNQLGKRNLTTEARLALVYKFKEIEAEKAKERQLANLNTSSEILNDEQITDAPLVGHLTDRGRGALGEIAKMAGVGHTTAEQYDAIQRKGTEEQKAEVAEGKSSIKKVYTQIQKAERLEQNKQVEWPQGKYRVIYADPPWKYGDERAGGNHGGAVDHYPTMSLQELVELPVQELAEDNAVLFMWTTSPLLEDSFKLLKSWNFNYKTQFIWDKVKHNMGHYNSVRHELLLIATKGSCTPDNVKLFDSVQTIERTDKHSEKPEEFRNIIDTLYTYGNKIELFARRQVDGWEVYGNEV